MSIAKRLAESNGKTSTRKSKMRFAGKFKSRTVEGQWHKVFISGRKRLRYKCTCRGFRFHGHCWHVDEVKERLEG